MIGRNTEAGSMLQSFIERIERLRAEKKDLASDESLVFAEAKGAGFDVAAIRRRLRRRTMRPVDLQEADAIDDLYAAALGEKQESSLHRIVRQMNVDITAREEVIEALKLMVPENGSIIVEAGGKPLRLTRDERGEVTAREVVEPRSPPASDDSAPRSRAVHREPPPEVDGDGAEALGREAFTANKPIVNNPFPFGDERRWRWDQGWQAASGSDGMGAPS